MNKIIDFIINVLKWPLAVCLVIATPALVNSYKYINFFTHNFFAFGCGILFFGFTILVSSSEIRSSMQIIAHELTHTLFSYLTLHWVRQIRLNPDGSGGSMSLTGRGNWLITLAPYFFPLFAFIYMLLLPLLAEACNGYWLIYAILGYFCAYYWATVLSQVHPYQTDIIREGYVFSGIVIVAGNLYVTGAIFVFVNNFWNGIYYYTVLIGKLSIKNLHLVINSITQYF